MGRSGLGIVCPTGLGSCARRVEEAVTVLLFPTREEALTGEGRWKIFETQSLISIPDLQLSFVVSDAEPRLPQCLLELQERCHNGGRVLDDP